MTDQEFETIFKEQFNPLCNLAYTVVKNSDEAKDIVQQVFLNFWQRRNDLKIKGSARGYFYKAVLNNALTSLSKSKKLTTIQKDLPENFSDHTSVESNELIINQMYTVIGELPEICQKVFRLSRFTELTNKEIAAEMNISVKAVEKHITKAFKILRNKMKASRVFEETMVAFIILLLLFQGVGYLNKF